MRRYSYLTSIFLGTASLLSGAFAAPSSAAETGPLNLEALPQPVVVVVYSRGDQTPAPETVDGLTSASLMPGDRQIGTTRFVADEAARVLKADLVEIEPQTPLPVDFQETIARNHAGSPLPLKPLPNLSQYKTIVLAGPNWGMHASLPVRQFLEDAASALKPEALITITTHTQYGPGRMADEAAQAFPGVKHLAALHFEDHDIHADPEGTLAELKNALGVEEQSTSSSNQTVQAISKNVRIVCEVEGHSIPIMLNGTPEADQFLAMLPMTVTMGEFGGREFYGPAAGSREIQTVSEGQYTFLDGTLTYCPTNDTVAIFYSQSSRPNLTMAVFPMGQVTGDLKLFSELPGRVQFTFRRAP